MSERPQLLAIDNGLTVTKAVVFDTSGRELAVADESITRLQPCPRHVERNMDESWQATKEVIRRVLGSSRVVVDAIRGVGVTAHGDGVYLVDRSGVPVAPGVLSLDSRAVDIVESWQQNGVADRALLHTGQRPGVSAPAAILAWFQYERPDIFDSIGWVLSSKDWIRFCLTGEIATDLTEASQSFTELESQEYSDEALALYGLESLSHCLPPIITCDRIAGRVNQETAKSTGLPQGLPVATGLHDVTAAAIGLGNTQPGALTVVAGTYSINETISAEPVRDRGSACRASFRPGEWMNMSISPASSANIDWFIKQLCTSEIEAAEQAGESIFDRLQSELESARKRDAKIIFHPFLYGSPISDSASAGFFGLQGWHNRGDMLRALVEGIAFNHRTHVDRLKQIFEIDRLRAAGGGIKNPVLAQYFADHMQLPVTSVTAEEVSALGTAICAGVASNVFTDIEVGVSAMVSPTELCRPTSAGMAQANDRYALYWQIIEAIRPLWAALCDNKSA